MPDINPLVTATQYLRVKQADIPVRIGYPRASSISKACMRLHTIATKHQLFKESKQTNLPSRMAFSLGNALHWWIQNRPDFYGDDRRGWWKCLACSKPKKATIPYFGAPPGADYVCPKCGAGPYAMEYYEHPMTLTGDPFYVTGHPDLFLAVNGGKFAGYNMVNELKSIKNGNNDKWDWDNITYPIIDHVYQVITYIMFLHHDRIIKKFNIKVVPDQANVSYIAKGNFGNKLPIKTFTVEKKRHLDVVEDIEMRLGLFAGGFYDFPRKLAAAESACSRSDFTHYMARTCPGQAICQGLYKEGYR